MNFSNSISSFVEYAERRLTELACRDYELQQAAKVARKFRAKQAYEKRLEKGDVQAGLTPQKRREYQEIIDAYETLKEIGFSGRQASIELGIADSSLRYMKKQLEE
jgi:hypothetical protein